MKVSCHSRWSLDPQGSAKAAEVCASEDAEAADGLTVRALAVVTNVLVPYS